MDSEDAFRRFGHDIESDPIGVLLAKWRRDAFIEKLKRLPDVVEVIPSGSLARGTQIGPVHDVDLIVVFDRSAHPGYGSGTESARAAMMHLEEEIRQQMHPLLGTDAALPNETEICNHVVKCPGVSMGPFESHVVCLQSNTMGQPFVIDQPMRHGDAMEDVFHPVGPVKGEGLAPEEDVTVASRPKRATGRHRRYRVTKRVTTGPHGGGLPRTSLDIECSPSPHFRT